MTTQNHSGWKRVRLEDVTQNISSEGGDKPDRCVGGDHLDSWEPRVKRWASSDDGRLGPTFSRIFRAGAILVTSRDPWKKAGRADFDGLVTPSMFIWRPIDEAVLLPELLLGVAGSERFQRHVEQMARGSVNKFVTWSDVKDFLFDLPPIEEQRYIVELLRAVDDEIDAVIQALKTAEAFIPIGFEQLTSSADGSRISLAEALSDVRAGVSVTGLGRPPRDDEDSIIKVSAVKDAKFVSSERKALSPNHNLPDSALITRGDILITRSNTARLVGKVARVQELPSGRIYCPDTIYRLIVNREIVLPEYLELACLTPDFHRAIQQEAKGSSGSMQKISIKRLLSIVIWVPGNLADQERIVTAARALREVADSISDVASRASGLRSSLLRELIR